MRFHFILMFFTLCLEDNECRAVNFSCSDIIYKYVYDIVNFRKHHLNVHRMTTYKSLDRIKKIDIIAQSCINFGQNHPFCKLARMMLICYLDIVNDKITCKKYNLGLFQVSV